MEVAVALKLRLAMILRQDLTAVGRLCHQFSEWEQSPANIISSVRRRHIEDQHSCSPARGVSAKNRFTGERGHENRPTN
jgi:hypothetical protein